MINESEFLRYKAAIMRDLALQAPEISEQLSQLADELDVRAAELEGDIDDPGNAESA